MTTSFHSQTDSSTNVNASLPGRLTALTQISPVWWAAISSIVVVIITRYHLRRNRELDKARQRLPARSSLEFADGIHQSVFCKEGRLVETHFPEVLTLYDAFKRGYNLSKDNQCLGTFDSNTGAYRWATYSEIWNRASRFVAGLALSTGIGHPRDANSKSNGPKRAEQDCVGFWSLNRAEFVIAQYGCFMQSLVIVPLYDTLGAQAMRHIIKQTGMRVLVCDRVPKLELLLADMKQNEVEYASVKLQHIVLFDAPPNCQLSDAGGAHAAYEGQLSPDARATLGKFSLRLHSMQAIEATGKDSSILDKHSPPSKHDTAFLCYTSGTTGVPKGVILTHRNMVANASGIIVYLEACVRKPCPNDLYLSYLPMAHMLEQSIQLILYSCGAPIALFRGDVRQLAADCQLAQPTLLCAVPRVLNRIYDRIQESVNASFFKRMIFKLGMRAKMYDLHNGIARTNTIWDKLFFGRIRKALGGRVRLMVVGSAPTSDEVFNFFRCALNGCEEGSTTVANGYGQTEAVAGAFLTLPFEPLPGHTGGPFPSVEARLVDVPEMDLVVSRDGRGEVCLRGPIVSPGYYQDPENTLSTFEPLTHPEADRGAGVHKLGAGGGGWLHTGDIGYWNDKGALKIVDRKKFIFKLAQGEYIAPEKIESVLAQSKYIAQILVDGNSFEVYPVGLATIEREKLFALATELGIREDDPGRLCKNKKIRDKVLAELTAIGKRASLNGFEQIKALTILPELFTVEEGFLTPTLKLRRLEIRKKFEKELAALFAELHARQGDGH